jgi:rSAM/selenodomain-associated transferase 1
MRNALILMTRAPIPGKTKTRLEPFLSPEQCASLHRAFIMDIYNTIKAVNADIIIYYTPERHKAMMHNILGDEVRLIPQIQGGLGERMHQGLAGCFAEGYDKCVLIGSDIPTISVGVLENAFQELNHKDVVIGPTEDGGYYLIGMKKSKKEIFDKKFYGTQTVYQNTLGSIKKAKLTYSEMPIGYDIDVYEDLMLLLKRYKVMESMPHHTFYCLRDLGLLGHEIERELDSYGADA